MRKKPDSSRKLKVNGAVLYPDRIQKAVDKWNKSQSSPKFEKWETEKDLGLNRTERKIIDLLKVYPREYNVSYKHYITKKFGIGNSSEYLHKKIKDRNYEFKTYEGALKKVESLKRI